MLRYIAICFLLNFLMVNSINAQQLDLSKQKKITLSDSTSLVFYPSKVTRSMRTGYYFLPVNLKVSKRDSISEFSMMTYDLNDDGKADGGIMHLLLTWGLTKNQMKEALTNLRTSTNDSTAIILGGVNLEPLKEQAFFITPTELGNLLKNAMSRGGKNLMLIPLSPGGKRALSFRFKGAEMDKLKELLADEDLLKETFISFGFKFQHKPIYLKKSLFELIHPLL